MMLSQHLIDILNSGDTWAFVGNGASVDAGVPSWEKLLEQTHTEVETKQGPLTGSDKKNFDFFTKETRLTDAFSNLKSWYGSNNIDLIVSEIVNKHASPGDVTKTIASWPFQAYVTTNYDHLIETALSSYGGWASIGNTANENRKISGDVKQIVWHPHGGAKLGDKNSRLVLATSDYDEIYPSGSPTLTTLEAIFKLKRIVFIGFGFRDPDLIATLERVGRFISPERPAFAFLAHTTEADRLEYAEKYRVQVIPYNTRHGNHSDLSRVLNTYGAFIVDRSFQFGKVTSTPDYDEETVGLLTQNKIAGIDWLPSENVQSCLIQGYVVSQLNSSSHLEERQLIEGLAKSSSMDKDTISRAIDELIHSGAVQKGTSYLELTAKGLDLAADSKSEYELKKEQFINSILARAMELCTEVDRAKNICEVTVRYLEKTCRQRGLGVAQQLAENGATKIRARAVALLQDSKSELDFAKDRDAAIATVQCIRDVFSDPRTEERRFLGYLTQAYFAKQLLGIDPATIAVKKENLAATVFISDSNFIIPLLAAGSIGHQYAWTLFKKLNSVGCNIVISDWLLTECLEHARWAWSLLNSNGSSSAKIIDALRGAHGYKPNAFLTGYINHEDFGPDVIFKKYFSKVFGNYGEIPKEEDLVEVLGEIGIQIKPLSSWDGFQEVYWGEKEEVQQEIKIRREANGTYKHDRQIMAEAEVAVIVTMIRNQKITLKYKKLNDAYFLSYSRVVDGLKGQAHRVCIAPESLFEWLLSISEISDDDANAVYDQLLWELSRQGVDVVPRRQLLAMFSNTIDVSRNQLAGVIEDHKDIIRELYSSDPVNAFSDIDPLMVPGIAESVSKEVLRKMRERLEVEQEKRTAAERAAKRTVFDAKEYAELKARQKQKQSKAKKQKRAAASCPRKKKKKK
ncbi:MAG: SIR2 family protein [Gimesia sp.]